MNKHDIATTILLVALVILTTLITFSILASGEVSDCYDCVLAVDESIILIGYNQYFLGYNNHFANYVIVDNSTFIIVDHFFGFNQTVRLGPSLEEYKIRDNVYYDGFDAYYKLFDVNETPPQHWKVMI